MLFKDAPLLRSRLRSAPADLSHVVAKALERPEWTVDPRFRTNALRWEHLEALNQLIEAVTLTRDRAR